MTNRLQDLRPAGTSKQDMRTMWEDAREIALLDIPDQLQTFIRAERGQLMERRDENLAAKGAARRNVLESWDLIQRADEWLAANT